MTAETPVDDLRRELRHRLISNAAACGTAFLKITALEALAAHTDLPDATLAVLTRTAVTTVEEIRDTIAKAACDRAADPDGPRRGVAEVLTAMLAEDHR